MANTINIIVTASIDDDDGIDKINALPWYRSERGLVSCDHAKTDEYRYSWYGGSKYLETNIWIGAFSELDVNDLIAAMRQVAWNEPDCVRLYVSEGDQRFTRIDWQNT